MFIVGSYLLRIMDLKAARPAALQSAIELRKLGNLTAGGTGELPF